MTKANVVVSRPEADRILPRLSRYLRNNLGWSLSERPDPLAQWNYFMPYIEFTQRFSDFNATKTAAYFSHYDPHNPTKALWWDIAAERVDLRIVTAPMYYDLVAPTGPTVLIPAPVDPIYSVGINNRRGAKRIVGVSGFTYSDGRKGEGLVGLVAHSERGQRYTWKAAGRGWPVPTKGYPWDAMPAFYRSLDIYLCAAQVEGVPLPPLEALACGIPVVIPIGVGYLDELPDDVAIVRYDLEGGAEAVASALDELSNRLDNHIIEPRMVAKLVSRFTPDQWAALHLDAFQQATAAPLVLDYSERPDWHDRAGIMVVAFGEPSRACARTALSSWKAFMPEVPTCLISDRPLGPEDVFVEHIDEDIGGRSAKTKIWHNAPEEWEYVLYLDADTETISSDVRFFFDLLVDGWDFVICKNPNKYHTFLNNIRPDNKAEHEYSVDQFGTGELLNLNGGVFAFYRSPATECLMTTWHEEWNRYGGRDQAALLRSLWRCPVRMYVLGSEWNTVTRYHDPAESAGILHYPMTARRWTGLVHGRLDSEDAWSKVR